MKESLETLNLVLKIGLVVSVIMIAFTIKDIQKRLIPLEQLLKTDIRAGKWTLIP